jgi:ketosteroid isomerase-like protein
MTSNTPRQDIERIYRLWDEALGKRDLEASLALYAEDASIESPLVQHLLKTREGVVQGKSALRKFIACSRPTRRSASGSSRASSPTAAC